MALFKPLFLMRMMLAAFVASFLCLTLDSRARVAEASQPIAEADVVFNAKVYQLDHYFSYKGAILTPMEWVRISYGGTAFGAQQIPYEDLWYRGGDIIGCRRYNALNMEKGKRVIVDIDFPSRPECTPPQAQAAADTAARLLLDVNLNNDLLQSVQVSADNYFPLLAELEHNNFEPFQKVRWSVKSNIFLPINSTDGSYRESLLYVDAGDMP